jgi:hypothetical protein
MPPSGTRRPSAGHTAPYRPSSSGGTGPPPPRGRSAPETAGAEEKTGRRPLSPGSGPRAYTCASRSGAGDELRSAAHHDLGVARPSEELDGRALAPLRDPEVEARLAQTKPSDLEPPQPRRQPRIIERQPILTGVGLEAEHAAHQMEDDAGRPRLRRAGYQAGPWPAAREKPQKSSGRRAPSKCWTTSNRAVASTMNDSTRR